MSNIFDVRIPPLDSENFQTLLKSESVEIKTIVSNTLKTTQTFVQVEDEWVVVLQGCAKIEMDGVVYKLKKGILFLFQLIKSILYSKQKR